MLKTVIFLLPSLESETVLFYPRELEVEQAPYR